MTHSEKKVILRNCYGAIQTTIHALTKVAGVHPVEDSEVDESIQALCSAAESILNAETMLG